MEDRKARRRAAIAKRKAATKARLAAPVTRPTVPVALSWERRPRPVRRATPLYADGFSPVMSGDADDLDGSLEAIEELVGELGPALRGVTRSG